MYRILVLGGGRVPQGTDLAVAPEIKQSDLRWRPLPPPETCFTLANQYLADVSQLIGKKCAKMTDEPSWKPLQQPPCPSQANLL